MGQGTLDHLPDIRGTVLGASASSPAFPGGGGEDALGPMIARPKVEAATLEAWVLGKRAVSLVGSTVEVEQAAEATQQPLQRVEGALGSGEGRPAPTDTGAVLLLRKHQAEAPALVPRKALKVSTSSTTQWVVEAQAAIQRGAALARADPKEPVTQGGAVEAITRQVGEEAPTPREAEALEPDEAEAPSIAEAAEGEDEATEAEASRTTEAEVAEAEAPETTEAEVAEAGVGAVDLAAQEVETEAGQASVPPLVQGPPPSRESAQEVESTSGSGGAAYGCQSALDVVSSHYAGINLEAISDGYVLAEDDEEAKAEVMKLVEAAKGPSTALAKLF
ncbi:uncharacterized protein [Miscanthus floridulus]|uniref:uncharacterized protein n=1 Tax=Miscanthus floridulus TaxID=154761 RepID=UPI003459C187